MTRGIYFALFVLFWGGSCTNAPPKKNSLLISLDSLLAGRWEQVGMEVFLLSPDGQDSSFSISVKEGEWEAKLGMRPILTEFFPDHKYRREYYDLNDSLREVNRGIWNLFGDTLMLIEPEATYQYRLRAAGTYLHFETYLDWDGDGVEDDEYTGVQKKIQN